MNNDNTTMKTPTITVGIHLLLFTYSFWHFKSFLQNTKNERSCICMLVVSILSLPIIIPLDIGTVLTVLYVLCFHYVGNRNVNRLPLLIT